MTLVSISDPRTVTAQRGPNAGNDVTLIDWTFALDDLPPATIDASTSTASGPRSKMFAFLTALFGGQAPPVGTQLEKNQLIGRSALATINHDDGGWPRISNLGAIPRQPVAAQRQAPATPTDSTAMVPARPRRNAPFREAATIADANGERLVVPREPVAADDDSLPF